jgi:hypothetical protein
MTKDIRWRIITLQVVLTLAFGCLAGFLFWGSNYTHNFVHDQLAAQKIQFPATISAKLYPDIPQQYAGQWVTDGEQARAYANGYINVHLQGVANGQTYSQVSAAYLKDPTNTKLAGERQTLFMGETLRGMLLNAWGWWTVGTYAFYAAIAMTVATLAVFGALMYELFFAKTKPAPVARVMAA